MYQNLCKLNYFGQILLDFHEISPEFHQNFTELAAPPSKSPPYHSVSAEFCLNLLSFSECSALQYALF